MSCENGKAFDASFMEAALRNAELALASKETPVGCVFVKDGQIIGHGMNDTNKSLNGTRHAEFVALEEILANQSASVLKTTDLYVTVEPCIMCASMLRQYGLRRVFYGCKNNKFGGTGGVLSIHEDRGTDSPISAIGGIHETEAIELLRKFYLQGNNNVFALFQLANVHAKLPNHIEEEVPKEWRDDISIAIVKVSRGRDQLMRTQHLILVREHLTDQYGIQTFPNIEDVETS